MGSKLPQSAEEFFSYEDDGSLDANKKAQLYRISIHGDNTPVEDRPVWQVAQKAIGGIFSTLWSFIASAFKGLIAGTSIAGVVAGSMAAVHKLSPNEYQLATVSQQQNFKTSLESKGKFDFLASRYNGMFDDADSVYVFTTSPHDVKVATKHMSENAKKVFMNTVDDIENTNVSATMLGFISSSPQGDKHSAVIVTGNNPSTKEGVYTLDHEAYHAWEMMNPDYKFKHEDPLYNEYLSESGADVFAAMMHIRDHGSKTLHDIIVKNETHAAPLFDLSLPLDSTLTHYTNGVENSALATSPTELQSLSVTEIAKLASAFRNNWVMSYEDFMGLKDFVSHVRRVTGGTETVSYSPDNNPQFQKWVSVFNRLQLPFEHSDYDSARTTISHYADMHSEMNKGKSFEVRLDDWQQTQIDREGPVMTSQKTGAKLGG